MKLIVYWFLNIKVFSKYYNKIYVILKIYIYQFVILMLVIINLDFWVRFGFLSCSDQQNL